MTRQEAERYWMAKYEAASKWDDPYWEASERKAHRRYVDAIKVAIEALQAEAKGYCHRIKPKQDLISRAKLFNKLATVQAPPEANEYKAEVYKIIQSMGTEEENDEQ